MTDDAELGSQVFQNVIAVDGFAYGVIGADIHVFANGLPLYLLANWRPTVLSDQDWLRELPSRMLNARRAVVPFTGREDELAQLGEWRDSGPRLAARWLHGPGGQGKSRLAGQFAADSAAVGWKVITAFHGADADTPKSGSQDMRLTGAAGLLVIVDYADRWRLSNMTWLLKNALLHHDGVPTRVLLVARDADSWPAVRAILDSHEAGTSSQQLFGLSQASGLRASMFAAARNSFAAIYGLPDATGIVPPGSLDDPELGLTLAVHMAALVAVDAYATGRQPPSQAGGLSMYLLDRERLHWARLYGEGEAVTSDDSPYRTSPAVMNRAVFTAVLTGSVTRGMGTTLLETLRIPDPDHVLDDHAVCYPSEDADSDLILEPLYPDRLAEDFLALTMPGHDCDYPAQSWAGSTANTLLERRSRAGSATWIRRAVTVLASAAQRWPHIGPGYLYPCLRRDPRLAIDAGSAALSLLAGLQTITPSILTAIEEQLPDGRDTDLAVGVAALTARLAEHRLATRNPVARARILHELAMDLLWAGRYQEALAAAEEDLTLTRQLAQVNPSLHEDSLAYALQNLGVILSSLGRQQEALTATGEATEIRQRRAQAESGDGKWHRAGPAGRAPTSSLHDADTPRPSLAMRIQDIAWSIVDEAPRYLRSRSRGTMVAGIRQIFEIGPALVEQAAFAETLANLATDLRNAGQDEEALDVARQAVAIWRRPGMASHVHHESGLALALVNLDVMLMAVGRETEGLVAAEEAVAIYRRLVQANRAAHETDLARALTNLGSRLGSLGRHEEAVAASEEAVTINRRLARTNPAAHQSALANSLDVFGMKLDEAGRLPEALAAAEEAVQIWRPLVGAAPMAYEPDLAVSVFNLATMLDDAGKADQGLVAAEEAVQLFQRLTQATPARFEPLLTASSLLLAGFLENLGEPGRAATMIDEAMAFNPESVALLGARGEAYRLLDRYEDALGDLDRAIGLDPDSTFALGSRGATYLFLDRYEDALADLDRAIELDPEFAVALGSRGATYLALDRDQDALADLDRAIQLDPDYAFALAMRGEAYRLLDRYEDALGDLDRAIGLDPDSTFALGSRGATYLFLDRYEDALADLDRAIELDPDYTFALGKRGEAYRLLDRYEDALGDLDRAIELDPELAVALGSRGATYLALDRDQDALADLDRAIQLDPDYAFALAMRGEAYRLLDRYEDALGDLDRAIGLDPDSTFALGSRGATYLFLDRYEDALADLDRAIELDLEDVVVLGCRGATYLALGRYQDALGDLDRAIELDPDYTFALGRRGEAYRLLDRHEDALGDLDRAIQLDPEYAYALATRAQVQRATARNEEALADLDRALSVDPGLAWASAERDELLRVLGCRPLTRDSGCRSEHGTT